MKTNSYSQRIKLFLFIAGTLLNLSVANAQLSYTFTSLAGAYTYNAAPVSFIGANQDETFSATQSIGFSFSYGCNTYTQFRASSNGWMTLGTVNSTATPGNNLATTSKGALIAPLWDDLQTGGTGSVNYLLTGTAPNRILTIEWLRMEWDRSATQGISFQVKLYETTNVIEFIYSAEAGALNSPSASIGINGGYSAADFYSLNGTGGAPGAIYGTETNTLNAKPATGQLYRWTPNNMAFVSCTTTQPITSNAFRCEVNQVVIGVQVVMTGCGNPVSMTQMRFNMAGSTIAGVNTNDVTLIHIYYSGNSSVFSPSNEFVPGGIVPSPGNITVAGSQTLKAGTNYFWVCYDINEVSATNANLIDATCTRVVVNGANQSPTVTAPAGSRSIAACSISPGGVKNNLAFWVKGNAGTSTVANNTAITQWNDQSGNARNATVAIPANTPRYFDNSTNNVNFNPVVDFDDAAQSAANGDYMDITSNGILSSGNNPYSVYAVIKPGTGNQTAAGKFLFSGVFGGLSGNTFNAFDIRTTNSYNDSWDINDLRVTNQWTAAYPSLATFDFNSSLREIFVSGGSVGTLTGNYRFSPDANSALGCQRAVTPNIEFFDGSIAEIISYSNTSHSLITRNKIESYLGIKYGVTLLHNYLSSVGVTTWNRSVNASYNTNIVGIGRDDNSALSQKESKSTSIVQDILTLYIGPTKVVNQVNNTGTFTAGDKSFFIAANNADPYMYTAANTERPAGICCRLRREWLSQKSNFTNTDLKLEFDFNVITPGYSPLNPADMRLLVDADGDFTNATILGSPAITISVSASVVTVTVPQSNFTATPYFTLASVSQSTPLPLKLESLHAGCYQNKIELSWAASGEINDRSFVVERSVDGTSFAALDKITGTQSAGLQSYKWTDESPIPGNTIYRLKSIDKNNMIAYSSIVSARNCGTNTVSVTNDAAGHNSMLTLRLQQNAKVEVTACDVLGRSLQVPGFADKKYLQQGVYQYPLGQLANVKGIYLLSVVINGNKSVYRIFN